MARRKERRTITRHAYAESLEFQLTRVQSNTGNFIRGEGGGMNISPKGLGLITDIPLSAGEILKLNLPSHPDRIPVPVFCEVRWVKLEGGKYKAGVEFIS